MTPGNITSVQRGCNCRVSTVDGSQLWHHSGFTEEEAIASLHVRLTTWHCVFDLPLLTLILGTTSSVPAEPCQTMQNMSVL